MALDQRGRGDVMGERGAHDVHDAGDAGEAEQRLGRLGVVAELPQVGPLDQVQRLDHVHAAQIGLGGGMHVVAAEGRCERRAPGRLVALQVLEGHLAAFGPHRLDQLAGPRAGIHVLRPLLRHLPQGVGKFRLGEVIARGIPASVVLREDGFRVRPAGEDVLAHPDHAPEHRPHLEALLGEVDRGPEQRREGQLAEALVRRLHARHEPRHQRGAPARHAVLRDRERVVLAEHRVPATVEVVDFAGGRLEDHEVHEARVADAATRHQGDLREGVGQHRIDGAAALVEGLEARPGRGGGGGADHHAGLRLRQRLLGAEQVLVSRELSLGPASR